MLIKYDVCAVSNEVNKEKQHTYDQPLQRRIDTKRHRPKELFSFLVANQSNYFVELNFRKTFFTLIYVRKRCVLGYFYYSSKPDCVNSSC